MLRLGRHWSSKAEREALWSLGGLSADEQPAVQEDKGSRELRCLGLKMRLSGQGRGGADVEHSC